MKKLIKKILGQKNVWILQSKFRSKEQRDLKKKRQDFYMQFLNKGSLYFDVGANMGNRIEPILGEGVRIVAIEPQKECLEYLRVRYKGDIDIVPMGVGEKEETKSFFVGEFNTISSFSKEWIDSVAESKRYGDHKWTEAEEVQLTTLDKLIEKFGVPDFVKVDVEGFELEVFKGLSHPIPVMSYEYTVPEQTQKAIDCLKKIYENGGDKFLCNYSIGESMEWALEKWLSFDDMLKHIQTNDFIDTRFGDIYVKTC